MAKGKDEEFAGLTFMGMKAIVKRTGLNKAAIRKLVRRMHLDEMPSPKIIKRIKEQRK